MNETILYLSQIGETQFVREYPWEYQPWRWCFQNGVAWNKSKEPVFNYATSSTLYSFLDLKHLTLFLVYGTKSGDTPFLANLTLQGVLGPRGIGRGSICSASEEYKNSIGATFEMEIIYEDEYQWKLKINHNLFPDQAPKILSETTLSELRYLATEFNPFHRSRWPH